MKDTQYKGMQYLKRKLQSKKTRVDLRYSYYEMKHKAQDLKVSTPDSLTWLTETLGWCGKAVDCLADRLTFREFADDVLMMNDIFQRNSADILPDSAILSALIASCCFVYISEDSDGFPRLQVIDGGKATGIIDPITGLLTEGYAVLKAEQITDKPITEAYFTPGHTEIYTGGKRIQTITNKAEQCALVPVIYKPDAKRPFGHSRISRACMAMMDGALRTIKRSEITAEFYSFPQKYVTGISPEAEKLDKWKSTISSMLVFESDDTEHHPVVGQFAQQSISPHIDQLKMFASAFAGETGLTMDDLGFPQDNPSSSEAIRAAHENLRLMARKAQRCFGVGLLNVGYVSACMRDDFPYKREVLHKTRPVWAPIFEPDAQALTGIGDAISKINEAMPGYLTEEKIRDLTGI